MRIVCPDCDATYSVPESALANRKTVRCARCGTVWAPLADLPASQPAPPPAAPPSPPPPPPAPEPPSYDHHAHESADDDDWAPPPEPTERAEISHFFQSEAVSRPAPSLTPQTAARHATPEQGFAPPPAPDHDISDFEPPRRRPTVTEPPADDVDHHGHDHGAPAHAHAADDAEDDADTTDDDDDDIDEDALTTRGAWMISLGIILLFVVVFITFREPIMRAWPASERVYNMVHLH